MGGGNGCFLVFFLAALLPLELRVNQSVFFFSFLCML